MRPRTLVPLVAVIICILCTLPMVLITAVRVEDSAGIAESVVVDTSTWNDSGARVPATAGVIIGGKAAAYGWDELPAGAPAFASVMLAGRNVIVFDNLNPDVRPGASLTQTVQQLRELGAELIFIAPDVLAAPDAQTIASDFPNTVFIQNVAQRNAVAQLLDVPPDAASGVTDDDSGTRNAVAGVVVLALLLGVGLWLALRVSNTSHRARARAAGAEAPPKRKRRRSGGEYHGRRAELEARARTQMSGFATQDEDTPLLHDLATYILGDQQFDDSFPIESAHGVFMGDCGLQISAYVNRYDPDKVTALRLWLFDARGLRTASALLASEDAAKDAARETQSQSSLVVRAEPGAVVTLETDTLRLQARVLDMRYGFADTLPLNSFFEHVVVEIAVFENA